MKKKIVLIFLVIERQNGCFSYTRYSIDRTKLGRKQKKKKRFNIKLYTVAFTSFL